MKFHYFLLSSVLWLTANSAHAVELVLLNWDEYLAESVIEKFTEETGHTIKRVVYDSDLERDEVLGGVSQSHFDLVVIDSLSIELFGSSNVLLSGVSKELSGLDALDSRWRDSCGDYGLPYAWGTVGIVYREDKVTSPPTSWADLLFPANHLKGHVGMLLDPVDTLIAPLKLKGHSSNTEDMVAMKEAYAMLKEQAGSVLTYDYLYTYLEESETADQLHMALAYNGDQYFLSGNDDQQWGYVVPDEGTAIWVDCMAVVGSSKNKKAALSFLEFINRPEIAAENVTELWVATPNLDAEALLDQEMLEDETVYPPAEVMKKSEQYRQLSDGNVSQRNRIVHALVK